MSLPNRALIGQCQYSGGKANVAFQNVIFNRLDINRENDYYRSASMLQA
jgi:hypothetical protein